MGTTKYNKSVKIKKWKKVSVFFKFFISTQIQHWNQIKYLSLDVQITIIKIGWYFCQ